jgi:signal transduction histidine kinase
VSRAGGYPVSQTRGDLLYRAPLSAPLNEVELIFSVADLPMGPGGRIVGWATFVLAVVLLGGLAVVYRSAAAQIDLTRQQQDFVAAVSHELKTPLTSIRMYGEILRAGWASEEKKKTYYDFIFHESERLSRLIANVLRLARLTRNGDEMDVKPATASELLSLVESKVASQVEQAGFRLVLDRDPQAGSASIAVDADSLVQILINLVDNALKFSAHSQQKVVEIGARVAQGSVVFRVRDYGPGIAPRHLERIFELFYRAEDELTRETTGTGIGLALVSELTAAMGGEVGVRNCQPGAEFTVTFPRVEPA